MREKNSGGVGCFVLGAVLIILPIFYVLSSGPMTLVLRDSETWNTVYKPLTVIHRISPAAGRMYDNYCNWWFDGSRTGPLEIRLRASRLFEPDQSE